jgi:F0F1-type ATP synthase delta subunit
MGELFEGYDSGRRKREAEIAERHRKEDVVDHELHELASLFEADAGFLKEHDITYEIVSRAMRVAHRRSPVVSVHYVADDSNYVMTEKKNGVKATVKSAPECARWIGEALFAAMASK